jgi:hypothetical protein
MLPTGWKVTVLARRAAAPCLLVRVHTTHVRSRPAEVLLQALRGSCRL